MLSTAHAQRRPQYLVAIWHTACLIAAAGILTPIVCMTPLVPSELSATIRTTAGLGALTRMHFPQYAVLLESSCRYGKTPNGEVPRALAVCEMSRDSFATLLRNNHWVASQDVFESRIITDDVAQPVDRLHQWNPDSAANAEERLRDFSVSFDCWTTAILSTNRGNDRVRLYIMCWRHDPYLF